MVSSRLTRRAGQFIGGTSSFGDTSAACNCSHDRLEPILLRSGPRWDPLPPMRWQLTNATPRHVPKSSRRTGLVAADLELSINSEDHAINTASSNHEYRPCCS